MSRIYTYLYAHEHFVPEKNEFYRLGTRVYAQNVNDSTQPSEKVFFVLKETTKNPTLARIKTRKRPP